MTSLSTKPTILSRLIAIDFPEAEKQRLLSKFSESDFLLNLISKHAVNTPPYSEFQKREKIPGFRPGVPEYNKQAFSRIVKYLRDEKNLGSKILWDIYRAAYLKSVQVTHDKLSHLFSSVAVEEITKDGANLLRTICVNAFDYSVSEEDIRDFYECSWLPRVSDLDDTLRLCAKPDANTLVKRQIMGVEKRLDDLSALAKEVQSSLQLQRDQVAKIERNFTSEREQLDPIRDAIRKLPTDFYRLSATKVDGLENSLQDCAKELGVLRKNIKVLEEAVKNRATSREVRSDIKEIVENLLAEESKRQDKQRDQCGEAHTKALTGLKDELGQKIQRLEEMLDKVSRGLVAQRANPSTYQSPIAKPLVQESVAHEIDHLLDFSLVWSALLSDVYGVPVSAEQALVYHSLLDSNDIVVIDDYRLLNSWIEALSWRSCVMHVAASPLWASEQNWAGGAEFLFSDVRSSSPRILVIHNYDLGLVDAYLLPTIVLWSLQKSENGRSKMILIPADGHSHPSDKILLHASYIDRDDPLLMRDIQLQQGQAFSKDEQKLTGRRGVSFKHAAKWLHGLDSKPFDFAPIIKPLEISLPSEVEERFRRTYGVLSAYFEEPQAQAAAFYHEVTPWVQAKCGEGSVAELAACLRQLVEAKY